MIGSGIEAQLAAKQANTDDLVRFKQQMDGLKDRLTGPDDKDKAKQLRGACEKFEAVFISKLWKDMKKTVPKEGFLHSKQEDMYMSMFDRDFSEKMAAAGGIGLADMIYQQLSEKLKNTSRDALPGAVQIRPVENQPIALQKEGTPIPLPDKNQGMTLEEWGGTVSQSLRDDSSPGQGSEGRTDSGTPAPRPLTDVEVKAELDALTRRLEAERIKSELLGTGRGYRNGSDAPSEETIGRNIATNG